MSKEKAIEKIHKSIDILKWYRVSKNEKNKSVCFLREALKELEEQNIEHTPKGWNIYIKSQSVPSSKHRFPNYFYYCVPWYLSGKVLPLLPSYAGLIVLTENGKLNEVRRASLLHTDKYTDEDLKLCNKFYYAYRNWKERVEDRQPTKEIKRLKDEIAFLKAEYKAVAGCDIQDAL